MPTIKTKEYMACTTCGSGKWKFGQCRCCELVDGDTSKKVVRMCTLCGVYLCKPCYTDPLKRIKAFGKQFFSS